MVLIDLSCMLYCTATVEQGFKLLTLLLYLELSVWAGSASVTEAAHPLTSPPTAQSRREHTYATVFK